MGIGVVKQNQSIYDINEALKKEDLRRTPAAALRRYTL
jgi:hypothetical protein